MVERPSPWFSTSGIFCKHWFWSYSNIQFFCKKIFNRPETKWEFLKRRQFFAQGVCAHCFKFYSGHELHSRLSVRCAWWLCAFNVMLSSCVVQHGLLVISGCTCISRCICIYICICICVWICICVCVVDDGLMAHPGYVGLHLVIIGFLIRLFLFSFSKQ